MTASSMSSISAHGARTTAAIQNKKHSHREYPAIPHMNRCSYGHEAPFGCQALQPSPRRILRPRPTGRASASRSVRGTAAGRAGRSPRRCASPTWVELAILEYLIDSSLELRVVVDGKQRSWRAYNMRISADRPTRVSRACRTFRRARWRLTWRGVRACRCDPSSAVVVSSSAEFVETRCATGAKSQHGDAWSYGDWTHGSSFCLSVRKDAHLNHFMHPKRRFWKSHR